MGIRKFINEFEATGRMVERKKFGYNSELITLLIKTNSGRDMYPQFVCSSKILPQLNERQNLTIKGHVGNIPLSDKYSEETKFRQRFIADSVEITKTLTELKFGVKGKFPPESSMNIYLRGNITIITEDEDWYQYHIQVGSIAVTVSMKKLERHLKLAPGDAVCCVCRVSTAEKGEGENKKRFENIQVSDLAKIEFPVK